MIIDIKGMVIDKNFWWDYYNAKLKKMSKFVKNNIYLIIILSINYLEKH